MTSFFFPLQFELPPGHGKGVTSEYITRKIPEAVPKNEMLK